MNVALPPENFGSLARWQYATNGYAGAVPAHGLVAVSASDAGGRFTVTRPSVDGARAWVNGSFAIAQGGGGVVTCDYPALALYDTGDGTPAVGETWGAGAGSFKLRKNKAGFRVCGTPDTTNGLVPVEADTGTSRLGWFARLTTSSGSPAGWKWYEQTLNSSGVMIDYGSESASYNAFPCEIDPTLNCNPMPGMRVWMWTSRESGKYEFMVVLSPPLLCQVTGVSGTSHTVKQKTWSGGTIADYSPATSYSPCRSVTGATIPDDTLVLMWKIPDVDGDHWIMPITQPLESYLDYFTDSPHAISGTTWSTLPDITVTVPAGTWDVSCAISGTISGTDADVLDQIEVRLYDSTAGAAVPATQYQLTCLPYGMTGVQVGENAGQAGWNRKLTVAVSTTYVLQTRFVSGAADGQIVDAMIEATRWHAHA